MATTYHPLTWHLQQKLFEEVINIMTVSIPLVLIVGAVVFAAWRYMGLRAWQAVVCLLFGFLLAATTAAPSIQRLVTGLIQLISGGR